MKRFAVAGCLMVLTFAGVVLADEKALKELEGTYAVVGLEKLGKSAPKEIVESSKVSIKGDLIVLTVQGNEQKAKIKVDPSKTPNTIDFSPTDGPAKGKTFPGIYKAEKGEVTIVFHHKEGTERPKEFKLEADGLLLRLKKAEEKK